MVNQIAWEQNILRLSPPPSKEEFSMTTWIKIQLQPFPSGMMSKANKGKKAKDHFAFPSPKGWRNVSIVVIFQHPLGLGN